MSNALDDLRQTLADVICSDRTVDNWQAMPSDYDLADAIIAALPRMVKPLEWGKASDNGALGLCIISDTPFGRYVVEWWSGDEAILITPGNLPKPAAGEGAAKAAAQDHHVAQILSAFGVTV